MRTLATCFAAVWLIGCHTMTFDVSGESTSSEISETNHYFFWGLTPQREIDVSQKCPDGAAEIREQTTFVNGLGNLITLGFWFPRSVTFRCAEGG